MNKKIKKAGFFPVFFYKKECDQKCPENNINPH